MTLDEFKKGYYFVHFNSTNDLSTLASHGVSITPSDLMSPFWLTSYLDKSTAMALAGAGFYLRPVTESDKTQPNVKLLSEENWKLLVRAHESFNEHKHGLKRFSKHFFMGSQYSDKLLTSRKVLSIVVVPPPTLLNRYATGTSHSAQFSTDYDGYIVTSEHKLFRHGLTGAGQVVAVIDSGLDHRHCFFNDPKVDVVPNKTLLEHRKIIRYEAFADATDAYAGHGTHVCGTLLGHATCDSCSIRSFNGQAPDAKVYFADAGYERSPSELGADYDFDYVMNMTHDFGAGIMSNSWGFPSNTPEIREMFDEIGYQWPDIAMFFAAGNSGREFDSWVPGNSKNTIGVAGVTRPEMYKGLMENKLEKVHISLSSGKYQKAQSVSGNTVNIFSQYLRDPVPNYLNQTVGKGIAIVRAPEDEPVPQSTVVVLTDRKETSITEIPVFGVSSEFLNEIESAGTASITLNFTSEANGPSYGIAGFSSLGPTVTGLLKPDILAVGYAESSYGMPLSQTPKGCTANGGLTQKGGTSIACPNAAGISVLMRQYFVDGFYPSGAANSADRLVPDAAFLRALIINSAGPIKDKKRVPSCRTGFGITHASQALVFADDEDINSRGLRVTNEWIITEFGFTADADIVVTNSDSPLVVSLAWVDPPVGFGAFSPVYVDLDLYIVDPSGKTFFGNDNNGFEETHSTLERIVIEKPTPGKYKIYVHIPNVLVPTGVHAAVIVSGPFPHKDFLTNPRFIEFNLTRYQNKCPERVMGVACQDEAVVLSDAQTIQIPPRRPVYAYWKVPEHLRGSSYAVRCLVTGPNRFGVLQLAIDADQVAKFGGRALFYGNLSTDKQIDINSWDHANLSDLYFTLYSACAEKTVVISCETDETNSPMPTPTFAPTPSTSVPEAKSMSLFVVVLFAVVSYLMFVSFVCGMRLCWRWCREREAPVLKDESQTVTNSDQTEERGGLLDSVGSML